MGLSRRGFALVVVLVAVVAVFALAMRGAVALRAATIEAGAWRDRQAMRRDATTAAVHVLLGLTAGEGREAIATGGSSQDEQAPAQPAVNVDDPELPEMPVQMQEFLRGLLDENQQDDQASLGGANRSSNRSGRQTGGRFTALRRVGLPREPIELEVAGRVYHVRLSDAAGVLNINEADEKQLVRYFTLRTASDATGRRLAHEALDWRDSDHVPRSFGAERETYLRRGVTIRNGRFKSIEELLYLPSMTPAIFEQVRAGVTVLGDGKIHTGSAPRDVLLSLPDLTEPSVDRILELRREGQLTRQTLNEAVSALASGALPMLRINPSVFVRITVEPQGQAPTYEGLAIVSDPRGVQALELRAR